MRKKDNNGGEALSEEEKSNICDLRCVANRNLIDLQKENPDLLIFPQSLGQHRDGIEKPTIFSLDDEKITTYNIMGFIGRNSAQLTIFSRFAKDDNNDYFLHYLLQKVFSINILDFDQSPNKENIWDFLLYLFPYYLKKAYSQGLYKAYRKEKHNDANVKGTIDVKRHIKKNIPFLGNVAYTTREHSCNNYLTQLVRHTIEHIKSHRFGASVLANDSEVRDIVSKFNFVTQNTYNRNSRNKIILNNLKPITHPYYTEYRMLQKICLRILRRDKITFGKEEDRIYGLLFDGAWLWEEYLNTLLKHSFIHPENKTGKNRQYLFENSTSPSFQHIYPDFISKIKPIKVGDAKYIPLGSQKEYTENSERATSIYYKTITYMYRFNSTEGFLLFPNPETSHFEEYKIIGTAGLLKKIGLAIPQSVKTFEDFNKLMNKNENEFKNLLK
ncbi:MAG: restriction endonuclease [Ignavibacteria bacterium]|nr:restriction endonuclease [Ignavibacteria bacterium]